MLVEFDRFRTVDPAESNLAARLLARKDRPSDAWNYSQLGISACRWAIRPKKNRLATGWNLDRARENRRGSANFRRMDHFPAQTDSHSIRLVRDLVFSIHQLVSLEGCKIACV